MNKMTAEKIIDFCKSRNIPVQAILYGIEYFEYVDSDKSENFINNETLDWKEEISSVLGKMEHPNSYGEGSWYDGKDVECVVYFVDHDVYLKSTDLYYTSYDGL